jgi:predicted PhzF superfamily epimerase YddE/YHI9
MIAEDDTAFFHTMSGTLTARRAGSRIELDFPALPVVEAQPPADILDAIGISPRYCGHASNGESRYLLDLGSAEAVRSLRPDFGALAGIASSVIVTARSDDESYDFVSRYFAPHLGVDEDPVTGSAHCVLLPYWTSILGRDELVGYQASQRGGVVHCRLAGDRAIIAGHAVTILRGELA